MRSGAPPAHRLPLPSPPATLRGMPHPPTTSSAHSSVASRPHPPGGRQPLPPALRRDERLQVTVTKRDLADLQRIGGAWDVPATTALYFLAAGKLAELRGEALASAGGDLVQTVSRWLQGIDARPAAGGRE